jgi:hypothetical protein
MLPSRHTTTLQWLYEALSPTEIVWALTGSTSFALQGLAVTPHDIDIQTDAPGAYAIERHFSTYVTQPVAFSAAQNIRSHFGRFTINGLVVEVMGDIQKRQADGPWEPSVPLKRYINYIVYQEMRLPVLSLAYEHQAYLMLGRIERARMIEEYLQQHRKQKEHP